MSGIRAGRVVIITGAGRGARAAVLFGTEAEHRVTPADCLGL